jgi:hypothetical protein
VTALHDAPDLPAIEARAASYSSAQLVADNAIVADDLAPESWRVVCEHWSIRTDIVEHRADRVVAMLDDGRAGHGPTQRLAVLDAAKGDAITEVLAPGELPRADLLRPIARACRDLGCDVADLPGEVHRLLDEVAEIPTHIKVLGEAHAREIARLTAALADSNARVASAVAAERARCAAVCRDIASDATDDDPVSETADACAEAIERASAPTGGAQ